MLKSFSKRLPKKLNLTYIYIGNGFDIFRAWQKTARIPNKSLRKNNLIHRNKE